MIQCTNYLKGILLGIKTKLNEKDGEQLKNEQRSINILRLHISHTLKIMLLI